MKKPNLPVILKRIAMTQMAIAKALHEHNTHDMLGRAKLFEESKAIVADLQAFTDEYQISVRKRP